MKRERIRKQYKAVIIGFIVLIVLCFLLFLYINIYKSTEAALVALIPISVAAFAFRFVLGRLYRAGYYSDKQALHFYEACLENNITYIDQSKLPLIRKIYAEQVFPISTDELEHINEFEIYKNILKAGKKLKEE